MKTILLILSLVICGAALALTNITATTARTTTINAQTLQIAAAGGCNNTIKQSFAGATDGPDTNGDTIIAGRFVATNTFTSCKVVMRIRRVGTLTGTWNARIYSHNAAANTPNTLVATSNNNPTIDTAYTDITFTVLSSSIVNLSTNWIAIYHSDGGDFTGEYIQPSVDSSLNNRTMVWNGSSWDESNPGNTLDFDLYD